MLVHASFPNIVRFSQCMICMICGLPVMTYPGVRSGGETLIKAYRGGEGIFVCSLFVFQCLIDVVFYSFMFLLFGTAYRS